MFAISNRETNNVAHAVTRLSSNSHKATRKVNIRNSHNNDLYNLIDSYDIENWYISASLIMRSKYEIPTYTLVWRSHGKLYSHDGNWTPRTLNRKNLASTANVIQATGRKEIGYTTLTKHHGADYADEIHDGLSEIL